MKIQAVIFDGFDELDIIGVYEPLRMAGFDVRLVTIDKQEIITAAHGLKIIPEGILDLEKRPDLLIIPSGGWLANTAKGARVVAENKMFLENLVAFHKGGVILSSVCTGALLLAKAGLLNGRPATTNKAALKDLADMGAKVVDTRVVDDGDIITAGGVTSSLHLGLWLIKRFIGLDKAMEIANKLDFTTEVLNKS
jgi:transcriptional regulator GlxA family with amidase domain